MVDTLDAIDNRHETATAVYDAVPPVEKTEKSAWGAERNDGTVAQQAVAQNHSTDLDCVLHLTVALKVELADRMMPMSGLLDLNIGSIVDFQKSVDDELSLVAVNKRIGRGRAVKVGEKFGLQITRIESVKSRISAIGDK